MIQVNSVLTIAFICSNSYKSGDHQENKYVEGTLFMNILSIIFTFVTEIAD